MELEVEHTAVGDYDVLTPTGEVDVSSYSELRDRIGELLQRGRANVVIDLTGTTFLDSTALGALIGGRRRAHAAGGSFAIICANPQLLKLFAVTKLDLVFEVLPSRDVWLRKIEA